MASNDFLSSLTRFTASQPTTPSPAADLTLPPPPEHASPATPGPLPSPSLSPHSSPASEYLPDAEFDLATADHAAFFRALFAPAPQSPPQPDLTLDQARAGLTPIVSASLKTAPSSTEPSSLAPSSSSTTATTSTATATAAPSARKRKSDATLNNKDAKARERVLRNRAAAQESRDKKRRYINDLEGINADLQSENARLAKRLKTFEDENTTLAARVDLLSTRLDQIQRQLGLAAASTTRLALVDDGFCDPAAVTNMAGSRMVMAGKDEEGAAPNDNRGNDDRHDGASSSSASSRASSKDLASSQQRKPSNQQRTSPRKSTPSSLRLPPHRRNSNLSRRLRNQLTSISRASASTSTSTSRNSKLTPKTSWPSAVWTTLSILFWITTRLSPLRHGPSKPLISRISSGLDSQHGPFLRRLLVSLSARDLRRLEIASLKNGPRLRQLYLDRLKRQDWPP